VYLPEPAGKFMGIYRPRPADRVVGFLPETWFLNLTCCTWPVVDPGTLGLFAAAFAAIAAAINGFLLFFSSDIIYLLNVSYFYP